MLRWGVAIALSLGLTTGCQPSCEERCASTQRRCADGVTNADICTDQCTVIDCVDCFRCLDEEVACGSDDVCNQRCLGCSRRAPGP